MLTKNKEKTRSTTFRVQESVYYSFEERLNKFHLLLWTSLAPPLLVRAVGVRPDELEDVGAEVKLVSGVVAFDWLRRDCVKLDFRT